MTNSEMAWWKADFERQYEVTKIRILPLNNGGDEYYLGNSNIFIDDIHYCA